MSSAFIALLLFLISCSAHDGYEKRAKKIATFPSVYHEMYEDYCVEHLEWGFVDQDGVPLQYDQGSGMGLGMRMYLGPNGKLDINRPIPPTVHTAPPLNNGADGTPIDLPPDTPPPPTPTGTWTYNVHNFSDTYSVWTTAEKNRMKAGGYILSQALPHASFESKVKAYNLYTNGSGTALNKTPTQIWNEVWNASEPSWNVGNDNDADVKYMYRRTGCSYIGSAAVPGNYINICMTVYNNNSYGSQTAARNMLHEWSHTIGFGHQGASGTARDRSVPYKLGDFVGEVSLGKGWSTTADALFPHNW